MNTIKEDTVREIVRKQLIKNFGALNEKRSPQVKAIQELVDHVDDKDTEWPAGLNDSIQNFLKTHLSADDARKYTGDWAGAKIKEANGPDSVFPKTATGLADFLKHVEKFSSKKVTATPPKADADADADTDADADANAEGVAKVKTDGEAAATAAAKAAEERAKLVADAEVSGVGIEATKGKLEKFVVTDRFNNPAFVLQMPNSFVSLAAAEGSKNRGPITRAFGSDTLRAFRDSPASSDGDQPFVINWGGYGPTMVPTNTMFGTDTLRLNDIEELGFEPGIKRKKVKGELKVAFSTLVDLYEQASKDLKKLNKAKSGTPGLEDKLRVARQEMTRLKDLVAFMNDSTYERLRINRRDGKRYDRYRYTPSSRGNKAWNAVNIKEVEKIFLNRNESGAKVKVNEAVEEIAIEKLIRKIIKDEN